MRSFFWLLFFIAYLLLGRWYFICQIKQQCVEEQEETDFRLNNLQFVDGETVVFRNHDHFRFDSASVAPLVNDDNYTFLGKVGKYLNDSLDRNLVITAGLRLNEQEIQSGFYDNLGIARADALRAMFVNQGLPEDRIRLDYFVDSTNNLRRPVAFSAIDTTENNEQGLFTFTHMTFSDANFEYNSAEFNPGSAFQTYADSVKLYFDQIDSVTLNIIGHTDSIASQRYNLQLGKDRADNAKQYFVDLGLVANRISTDSKGKEVPVAPNKTEEGRQKNRRVEIVIQ
ncbi:MAG: OmpA family protein [Bacteroidota bacterium]